jgi:hypothetical protein
LLPTLTDSFVGGRRLVPDSVAPVSTLTLSDSLPETTVYLWLNRCPGVPEQTRVVASCSGAVDRSGVSLLLAVTPAGGSGGNAAALQCIPAPASSSSFNGVLIPLVVSAGAVFRSLGGSASVTCALSGADRSAMGSFTVTASVVPTLWPIFVDAIVVLPDGSMRSTLLGAVNGSDALLAQSCAPNATLSPDAVAMNASSCTVQVGSRLPPASVAGRCVP